MTRVFTAREWAELSRIPLELAKDYCRDLLDLGLAERVGRGYRLTIEGRRALRSLGQLPVDEAA